MTNEQKLTIEKYLDHELSESELSLFVDQLRENPELLQELALAIDLKGMAFTSQHSQYKHLEDDIMNQLATRDLNFEDQVMQQLPPNPVVKKFPTWAKLAIAAQIILIPILLFIMKPNEIISEPQTLIGHVQTAGEDSFIVRGVDKINIQNGDSLFSKDQIFVQDESSLSMKYLDGSTLNFSSQSFVRLSDLNGQKHVELFSGLLTADIEKQAPGKDMIITTEHSECEVIGTQFTLSSSNVSALLDVTEGAVKYNQKSGSESVLVKADHYASTNKSSSIELNKNTKPLYISPLVTYHTPGKKVPIEVDLHGARSLYLVVSNGKNGNSHDHSAWLNPILSGPAGELKLTELPMKLEKPGYADIEINRGFYGSSLKVKGDVYSNGIAAHATSVIAWDLPPGYDHFKAEGAILDTADQGNNPNHHESVHFEVYTSIPEKKLRKLLIRKRKF